MLKKMFIVTGMFASVLAVASPMYASDRNTAPAAAATQGQPAQPENKMVMFVKDARTSAIMTIPIVSTENADLPVAEVNGERITVNDMRSAIGSIHNPQGEEGKGDVQQAARIDMAGLLQRLINVELMVQEARNIGLDELPEVKNSLDTFSQVTLRDLVRQDIWKGISASDAEVNEEYREAVREVKTSSAFFEKETDAKKAAAKVKSGKKFEDVVAQAVKTGKAQGSEENVFIKFRELDPPVSKALATMKIGSVGPICKVNLKGKPYFVLFRYEAEQFPENPAAREQAQQAVMNTKRIAALGAVITSLSQKNVTLHKKLFKSLDYGPKGPGLKKLMNDQRVVAEIKGDKPITVSQFSEAMQDKFFHGMKDQKGKKLAETKQKVIEAMVQKRLLYLEALNRGLDKSGDYKDMFKDYERNIVFGMFIQKAVTPGVKINEDDLRDYYKEHAAEYKSAPEFKIRNLVFAQKADALSALDKLNKGADFSWVKDNADGQVEKTENMEPTFEEGLVPLSSLAEDVQKVLAGARSEDYRLYASPQGQYHVLYVEDMTPPRQQTFEEVRQVIGPKVYYAKLNKSVQEWAGKLKATADIKIYLARSEK